MLKVTHLYGFGGGAGGLSLKSSSSYNGSSASSHSVTMPATFAAGDLLICPFATGSAQAISSFTGWTDLNTGGTARRIYYKIASGGDTASIVLSGANTLEASISAYGPTAGVDGTPTADVAAGDITLSAITTTVAGGLLVAVSVTANTVSTPSGFSLDTLVTPSSFNFYFFSKAISATGSTGTVLLDESSTGVQGGGLIYIKP
jgi:hypothetical protein